MVLNPRHLDEAAQRMRRLARQMSRRVGPDRRTGQRPSNRWERARKTCSDCGAVKAKLPLRVRIYLCDSCGLALDRDLNAARNLAALAREVTTAGSGSVAGRGADPKTRPGGPVAVKRQPGPAQADKTGTVPPQGGTCPSVAETH
ncbi:zinc ribbon domain-containing protein [Micromonospora sp. URMC 106]|uniref:zinc ribbon domain-containing protein n=1 Tax=Micromonospora sp. URMC 106 TaxID=3423408 RepID=UPI003F1B348F